MHIEKFLSLFDLLEKMKMFFRPWIFPGVPYFEIGL